jgi:hypothetical protein
MAIFRQTSGDSILDLENRGTWVQPDPEVSARILGYASRTTSQSLIRGTIQNRYGTAVKTVKAGDTGITYEVVDNKAFATRMAAGHIEVVSVGLGHKIVGAHATLFSEESQNFDILVEGTSGDDTDAESAGTDSEKASDLLDELRGGERFREALVRADAESNWLLGGSPILVEFNGKSLKYSVIDPGRMQVLFDESVETEDGSRPADLTDIEDATCVVIETGSLTDIVHSYLAIFARCEDYPQGRYVTFKSSGTGRSIPVPGSDRTWDWEHEGKPANPLTVYGDLNPELDIPEYPITIIYSGMAKSEYLLPVSDSLLREALEADVAASHIRATSADNARGTHAFEKSEMGGTQSIPRSLRGDVVLEPGQKLTAVPMQQNAPQVAWDLLKEQMTSTGQGYSVPDFYMRSEDYTVDASSGAALKMRSKALNKAREIAAARNTPSIDRLFLIERSLILMFADISEQEKALIERCEQTWDPGDLEIPEDEAALDESIRRNLEIPLYDTIEAVRVKYRLGTEAEAIAKYKELVDRAKKYPPIDIWGETRKEGGDNGNSRSNGETVEGDRDSDTGRGQRDDGQESRG